MNLFNVAIDDDPGNFPNTPVVGPPVGVPLDFDPLTFIETPDYQRLGFDRPGWAPFMARTTGTGYPTPAPLSLLEHAYKRSIPTASAEAIRYFDSMQCIDIPPSQISPTGTVWELARVHLQKFGTGVIERLATIFEDVTALDDEGEPLFSFGPLDGVRPCIFPIQHPDPDGGRLFVEFRLIATEIPSFADRAVVPPFLAGASPGVIPAVPNLRPPWNDLRQGYIVRWADLLQYLVGENVYVRLLATFSGETDRWRLRVGGRLGGYWNSAGPLGVALDTATRRTL